MSELDHNPYINGDTYVKRKQQQQILEDLRREERQRVFRMKKQQQKKRIKIMITTIVMAGFVAVTSLSIANAKKNNSPESQIENAIIDLVDINMEQNIENLEIIKDYVDVREESKEKLEISSLKAQSEIDNVIREFQESINKVTEKVGKRVSTSDGVKKYTDPSTWTNPKDPTYYYDFANISTKYGVEFIKELMGYNISYEDASEIWYEKLSNEERNTIVLTSCYDIVKNDISRVDGDIGQLSPLVGQLISQNLYNEYYQNPEETITKLKEFSNQTTNKISKTVIEIKRGRPLEVVTPVIDDYNQYTSSEMENLIYLDEDVYSSSRGGR